MENLTSGPGTADTWYYVIIQDPGTPTEQFVGYEDPKTFEKFIPAFKTKEDAQACFSLLPKDLFSGNYDAQAVIRDDLLAMASEHNRMVYLLDGKGTILDYLTNQLRS